MAGGEPVALGLCGPQTVQAEILTIMIIILKGANLDYLQSTLGYL